MITLTKFSTNQKGNSLIIVFLGVLVLALIGGAYYLGTQKSQVKTTQEATVLPQVSLTPVPDSTASWKDYTNQQIGISLKYPSDYFKYQQLDPKGLYLAPSQGDGGNGPKFLKSTYVWINVLTVDGSNISSIDEYIGLQGQGDFYKNAQKKSINIGGIPGDRINYSFPAVAGNVITYNLEGAVLHNGTIYKVTMSAWNQNAINSNQAMFDQILATFKFN